MNITTNKKEVKEIKRKIAKVFSRVDIRECSMCGAFLTGEEWKQFCHFLTPSVTKAKT